MPFGVHDLRKSYGGVQVLKGVDVSVADGEIHALLGANGAGKSTLIKCLSGAITPDSGRIEINGRKFSGLTPRVAQEEGVAVVYQELSLALSLTVDANIFLGKELRWGPFVKRTSQKRLAQKWLNELGVHVEHDDDLTAVGNAELQSIEIVKALASNPNVLILDEPTAALSEREAGKLGERLKLLRKRNLPVLYVTHRLSEVFSLADRVTVLRGGQSVLSGKVSEFDPSEIVSAIVGRTVDRARKVARTAKFGAPILEVTGLAAPGIGPLTFEVRPGEILGIYGLVGCGRTELLEALFGSNHILAGTVNCCGENVHIRSPGEALQSGLALVPSDRLRKSIFAGLSGGENLLASSYSDLASLAVRRKARECQLFDSAAANLKLSPRRPDLEARRYSGGNQQKLVLGRWLNEVKGCKVLMLDEPTQGVDVGARSDIYDALRNVVQRGDRAIIATSSEPEELVQIADRVIVLANGRIAGTLVDEQINETNLLALAHG